MSFSDLKRQSYNLHRGASNGAHITLVSSAGEYRAEFESATYCAQVLGDSGLSDLGDGILDVIPCYRIASEDMYSALQKLSQKFSVALVEYAMTKRGGQFICLWKISRVESAPPQIEPSKNVDDY